MVNLILKELDEQRNKISLLETKTRKLARKNKLLLVAGLIGGLAIADYIHKQDLRIRELEENKAISDDDFFDDEFERDLELNSRECDETSINNTTER